MNQLSFWMAIRIMACDLFLWVMDLQNRQCIDFSNLVLQYLLIYFIYFICNIIYFTNLENFINGY